MIPALLLTVSLAVHAAAQVTTTRCNTVNVCFAIDESSSISSSNFQLQTDAIVAITNGIISRAPGSAFSAVGFSSVASVIQNLTTDVNGTFIPAIQNNPQSGGGTASGTALLACDTQLTGAEDPRLIVLLTDGQDGSPTGISVADEVRANGNEIATIGVGSGVNSADLMAIASNPSFFTPVANFATFADTVLDIVDTLCEVTLPDCAEFGCIRCGRVLECYVNTGSTRLDEETCALVLRRFKFCPIRHGRRTICGQPCTTRDGVQCFAGESIPNTCAAPAQSGSPVRCEGGGPMGRSAVSTSFASYRICNGNKFICLGRCDRGFEVPTCGP